MILKLNNGTVVNLKQWLTIIVLGGFLIWSVMFIRAAMDRYLHDHVYKVAKVHECLGAGTSVQCRVETTDGDEVLTSAWAIVGSNLYQTCYIKTIDVPDRETKAEEWCYTKYKVGSPEPRAGHDYEWERYRNR